MSGSISFNTYPVSQRTHGVFAEIAPQGQAGSQNFRTLILGQMVPSATATANTPFIATGTTSLASACGAGSQIAAMYAQYVLADPIGEVWIAPQADDPQAQAATGLIVISGTASAGGVLPLYVGGVSVPVGVSAGDNPQTVATNTAAQINQNDTLLCTASSSGATVTISPRNKGPIGNEIDLRVAYYGAAAGEVVPAGLSVSFTPMSGGAQNPVSGLQATLQNLGTETFDVIIMPYTDAQSLQVMDQFLNDTSGRWSWSQMLYGGYFCAYRGTLGQLATFGNSRNAYQGTCIGFADSPTPASLWAAAYGAACAVSLRADPGLPLQELVLQNVLGPAIASRFDISARNTLLYDGISTFTVNASGQPVIDRAITFSQENASGSPDTTWLNVETPYSLVALIRDMQAFLKSTYARRKLVADGSNIPGGSNMVTSQTVLAAAIARYQTYCQNGQAQNFAAFKAGARAQNLGNGTVALLLPFNLVGQLRTIAMKINFIPG